METAYYTFLITNITGMHYYSLIVYRDEPYKQQSDSTVTHQFLRTVVDIGWGYERYSSGVLLVHYSAFHP